MIFLWVSLTIRSCFWRFLSAFFCLPTPDVRFRISLYFWIEIFDLQLPITINSAKFLAQRLFPVVFSRQNLFVVRGSTFDGRAFNNTSISPTSRDLLIGKTNASLMS